MYALRKFSTLLKDERFTKTERQTSANVWKLNAEDTRISSELARQSEAKRKQASQSEAIEDVSIDNEYEF